MRPHPHPRFKRQISALALMVVWGAAAAGAPVRVTFHGDSTLHAFQGSAVTERVDLATDHEASKVRVVLPVRDLVTGHTGRDTRMRAMFEMPAYGDAIAGVADQSLLHPEIDDIRAPVELSMHGRTQTVWADRRVIREAGEPPVIRLAFDVSLKAFGLTPPAVLGVIRVSDTVRVVADVPAVESEHSQETH